MEPEAECGYHYEGNTSGPDHTYTIPAVLQALARRGGCKRVFDAGCGNGVVAATLAAHGYEVTGVDASESGVDSAQKSYPQLRIELGSLYDDLAAVYGQFPHVICLEVVEHLFYPRRWAKTMFDLTEAGGSVLVTTPYHGYWKNLALAASGAFDRHFNPLWDYGHIKFFSHRTLTALLEEAGFRNIRYRGLGRIPPLAKSMLASAEKPR